MNKITANRILGIRKKRLTARKTFFRSVLSTSALAVLTLTTGCPVGETLGEEFYMKLYVANNSSETVDVNVIPSITDMGPYCETVAPGDTLMYHFAVYNEPFDNVMDKTIEITANDVSATYTVEDLMHKNFDGEPVNMEHNNAYIDYTSEGTLVNRMSE